MFEPDYGPSCIDCGDHISPDQVSVEEFEETAELVCLDCAEARAEQRDEDNSQFGVGA